MQSNKLTIKPTKIMLKKISLTGTLLACLAFNAHAGVQITKFDPPLAISAFATVTASNQLFNVLPLDFNLDGTADFNMAYGADSFGLAGIELFFSAPARVVVKQPLNVAALPLGTIIGSNLRLPSIYQWSAGYADQDDVTLPLGDHELDVVYIPNVAPTSLPNGGAIAVIGPGGIRTLPPTPAFPIVEGDVAGKAGVIAVEFFINGQPHYGYIQFDFRSNGTPFGGTGGVIYGWAYETQPGVPIVAAPIGDSETHGRNWKH